jgi:hypothetical protein
MRARSWPCQSSPAFTMTTVQLRSGVRAEPLASTTIAGVVDAVVEKGPSRVIRASLPKALQVDCTMRRRFALGVLLGVTLACGGETSRQAANEDTPSGAGGQQTSTTGSAQGGSSGTGALSGAGGGPSGASSDASGGAGGSLVQAGGSSGTGGASGDTGSGGDGGASSLSSRCLAECDPSEVCVQCWLPGGGVDLRCVTDPEHDPAQFASVTDDCDRAEVVGFDCTAPYECPEGFACSLIDNRCRPPMPTPSGCCFACGAPPMCDLCENDGDCRSDGVCTTDSTGGPDVCLTRDCESDSDCPPSLECVLLPSGDAGHCQQPCSDDAECMDQYACSDGHCFGRPSW